MTYPYPYPYPAPVAPPRPPRRLFVSPSAIETFWLCKRKWAFRAIDRIPAQQNEAALLGDYVHKLRENWLVYGIQPPDDRGGQIAKAGLEFLPPPRYPLVETKLFVPTEYGYSFVGRIDFFLHNQTPDRLWGTPGIPVVGDHKTTSSEDYVKNEETLATKDPQGTLYGLAALLATNAPAVDLHWSYMIKSSTPRQRQVRVRVSRERIAQNMEAMHGTARKMLQIVNEPAICANKVEANPEACGAFGGCPYQAACAITVMDRVKAVFTQQFHPVHPV